MKNKYIHSNDFYIKDDYSSYLLYFDYFLSPGFPLTRYIKNATVRKISYHLIRLGVIFLYKSYLYKFRYDISERDEDALIIFKGPGNWSSTIKLIQDNEGLKIIKTVFNKKVYLKEKKFYETYKDNLSKIHLPKHKFTGNNTIEIEFLKTKSFLRLITDGTLTLNKSLRHYANIKAEIEKMYKHKKDLIHGDLWTGNIFIQDNTYYLIDFGDSFFNNFSYDLYVLLYSITSKYNVYYDKQAFEKKKIKGISVLELLGTTDKNAKILEKQFKKYKEKRFSKKQAMQRNEKLLIPLVLSVKSWFQYPSKRMWINKNIFS